MIALFADTAYFIALLNPADHFHSIALDLARHAKRPVVTSYWVLAELGDAFSHPQNRQKFLGLVELLESDPSVGLLPPTLEQFQAGQALFASRSDKEWSLTDCISISIMQQRQLTDALTTDRHFQQAGFRAMMRD
jgi:uncharacterized protein